MLTEFRGQLDSVLSLLVGVVPRVIDRVKVHHMTRWEKEREELQETHCQAMEDTRRRKVGSCTSLTGVCVCGTYVGVT